MRLVIRWLLHLGGYFVVRDPLVPPGKRVSGSAFDDGLLVIVPSDVTDRLQIREAGDRGEHGFRALVPAQQIGAAESADGPAGAR